MSNTAVELALYNLLLLIYTTRSRSLLLAYSTVGVVGAIANSFLWNSRWAFRAGVARHGHGAARQRLLFIVQAVCNIIINDGLVALTSKPFLAVLPAAAGANLAKVVGMSASSLFSFVVLRQVVFR